MATTACWDCETVAHMTPVSGSESVSSGFFRDRVMGCFRCDGCGALNIAIAKGIPGNRDPLDWLASKSNLEWQPQIPPEVPEYDFPDVPTEIADAASEAYACRDADAFRAAVLLARSVIEATAKHKGITKGRLIEKIDAMELRTHVRDGAHEVRHFGNDMAHGDFVNDVSPEEAGLVLTLMDEVLEDVFQSPARVARAQAARQARQRQEAALAAVIEGKPLPSGMSPAMVSLIRASVTQSAVLPSLRSSGTVRPRSEGQPADPPDSRAPGSAG